MYNDGIVMYKCNAVDIRTILDVKLRLRSKIREKGIPERIGQISLGVIVARGL